MPYKKRKPLSSMKIIHWVNPHEPTFTHTLDALAVPKHGAKWLLHHNAHQQQ